MKKDFREKARQYEELRYQRELHRAIQDLTASCAVIVFMIVFCYLVLIMGQ